MRDSRLIGRLLALVAVLAAVVIVAVVLLGGGTPYTVHARFQNASQLVKGNVVQVAGVKVGTVGKIGLTDDGQADVTMKIDDKGYAPLKQGTLATVRQASLSGVANRYVDLRLPSGNPPSIGDGGVIRASSTTSAVDLDELFNTFDPPTRKALTGFIRGNATLYGGRAVQANRGWMALNPSIAASSRLFTELNRDTPLLNRFISASGSLVTDVASRRDDLAGLIDHLATTLGAIGRQKHSLATAIQELPPFMRRANTTFVNLRGALDDLDPLVSESKPVARKLRPLLAQLRPLARDARPTLRDLTRIIKRDGVDNDLIDLALGIVPLRDTVLRSVLANGKQREGAYPASIKALGDATPELAYVRPYAVDLTGWFDDFSHSGIYDALGGASRAAPYVSAFTAVNGTLNPILDPILRQQAIKNITSLGQRNRCPGAVERGSVYKPSPTYNCDATQVPLGP